MVILLRMFFPDGAKKRFPLGKNIPSERSKWIRRCRTERNSIILGSPIQILGGAAESEQLACTKSKQERGDCLSLMRVDKGRRAYSATTQRFQTLNALDQ